MSNASRWRRFGFFGRSTLSLPDDVWDDLLPEEALRDAIASGKINRQYQQQQKAAAGGGGRPVPPTGGADNDALLAHTKLLHLSCATVSFHPSLLPAPRLEKVGETVMMSACTSVGASCFPTGLVPSSTTEGGGTSTSDGTAKVPPSGTAVDQLTISTTDGNTSTATGTGTAHATNPAASFYYTCGLQLATLGNRNRAFLTSSPFQPQPHDGSGTTSQNPYSTLLSPLHGSLVFAYNNTCGAGGPTPTSSSAASVPPTSPVMEKVTRIFQSACAISGNTGMTSPSSSAINNSSTMLLQAAFNVSSTPDSLAAAVLTMGTLVLAFVSSPHSGLVHCVDVSMRCHPPSKDHPTTKAKLLGNKDNVRNSLYDNTTTTTPRNNEDQETDTTTAHKKTQSNTTIPALADQMSAITLEELEDLDGWRGFVNPFWKVIQQQSQQQSSVSTSSSTTSATTARERAIVQEHMMSSSTEQPQQQRPLPKIAAMSVYSTSHEARRKKSSQALLGRVLFQGGKNNKNKTNDGGGTESSTTKNNNHNNQNALQELVGHLYVAVATNDLLPSEGTGLCIMVDPHLRLETDLSSALEGATGSTTAPEGKSSNSNGMILYRPRVMSSKHNYYKFTCMDLRPPLLVVGTTIGVTLVYQFTPLELQSHKQSSSPRTTMDLILKMEIPPPGISLKDVHSALNNSTNREKQPLSHLVPVTSVQLTSQQQPPTKETTGAGSSSDTTGGAAASTTKKGSTGLKIGNQLSIGVGGPSHLFVCYGSSPNDGGRSSHQGRGAGNNGGGGDTTGGVTNSGGGGICCYNLLNTVTTSVGSTGSSTTAPLGVGATNVPRSRIDLDTRGLHSSTLTDVIVRTTTTTTTTQDATSNSDEKGNDKDQNKDSTSPSNDTMTRQQQVLQREECFQICWSDGLYTYTPTKRFNAIPIEGTKIAFCSLSSKNFVGDDDLDNNEPLGMARHRRQPLLSSSTSSLKTDVLPFVPSSTTMDGGSSTLTNTTTGTMSYSLVATWDGKSGRDAVDIYDTTNKLCAFHVLLSPNHRATQVSGICTPTSSDGRKGRNSAIIVTSGGAVITLTEKDTIEKVALLVDKELYAAAISLAFMDPYYPTSDIIELYVRYAEYLYDVKQDFEQSMEQYISTIGSIEPSFVITKFLDAPKIPLLVKYLKELRRHQKATHVHMELLRTCYLKLNNIEAAEQIATSSALGIGGTGDGMNDVDDDDNHNNNTGMMMMYGGSGSGITSGGGPSSSAAAGAVLANLMAGDRPAEALATLCALEAPQVANALKVHGATLARSLPRETAGIVMSLCDGTFSSDWSKQQQQKQQQTQSTSEQPTTSSETETTNAATSGTTTKTKSSTVNNLFQDNRVQTCDKYPASWFVNAFVEHPKLLRLVLAHCKRNHCDLEPTLRRTHLELTLEEWNNAKRTGDVEMERIRSKEAMTALTDSHAEELGVYEALVLVHQANFTSGEILLLEQLQMSNMLLERYAQIGGHRERRQMIAMCQTDSELLADVMSYFVHMASRKAKKQQKQLQAEEAAAAGARHDEKDDDSKTTLGSGGTTHQHHDTLEDIYDDLKETLELARTQKVLLPIRVARILAGEGPGSFSNERLLDQLRIKSKQPTTNTDEKKVGEWNNYDDDDTEDEQSSLMWSQKALARLHSVPLDIAMDYMSGVLNESNSELTRLKAEIVEYTKSCNDMEQEIKSLRALASGKADEAQDPEEWYIPNEEHSSQHNSQRMMPDLDIDELYQMLQEADATSNGLSEHANSAGSTTNNVISLHMEEEFWREMDLSDDRFDTICRFFAKGIIP